MMIIIKNREQRRCEREREKKNTKNQKSKQTTHNIILLLFHLLRPFSINTYIVNP